MKYLISLTLLSFILVSFSFTAYDDDRFEVDLGYNYVTGNFDNYNDNGLSIRVSYTSSIQSLEYFRWQASFQYINFRNDYYSEVYSNESGTNSFYFDLTNSQDAYILQGGLRFSPDRGLFNNNGFFRPYASFGIGLGCFIETTYYEEPQTWLDLFLDESQAYFLEDIEDFNIDIIYSIDLGFNIVPNNWNGKGIDIGIRYNMAPNINSYENYIFDTDEDGFINGHINALGETLNADYHTYYIGMTFPID